MKFPQAHIVANITGREVVHQPVIRLSRTMSYHLSQRARKKIEELWGEAKYSHGFRTGFSDVGCSG
jgi:hypothetical protein